MSTGLFITGTDTGCGKTEITLGLMHALQQRGERVLGMKPVASGAEPTREGLRNEDALRIQARCSLPTPYERVNPFAYELPIAPHLAAEAAGRPIALEAITAGYHGLAERADRVVVEGVGGWLVPLDASSTVADMALRLGVPVILVVGLRLGCINHALLTAESIRHRGVELIGWVGNRVDPQMAASDGNLDTLRARLAAPCLGVVPWLARPSPEAVAECLDIRGL